MLMPFVSVLCLLTALAPQEPEAKKTSDAPPTVMTSSQYVDTARSRDGADGGAFGNRGDVVGVKATSRVAHEA